MAVERKAGIPTDRENRPLESSLGFQLQTDYDLETYQKERSAYLTQEKPGQIQREIDFFDEQISRLTLESQSNLAPLQEQRQSLELRRLVLEERRRNLQTRITEGRRTKRPTGGDFKTEVKIVWGRIQLILGEWQKKPPNSLARVLVKPLAPLARQTHPLLAGANRELSSFREAIEGKRNEISLISSQTQREVLQQTLQRKEKEKKLESFLDEWALENSQRLTFYLLENPQKIDGLLERYSRRATQNPALEEGVTYLLWNLKAGFSHPDINAKEFSLWSKNFCPQKTLDEWRELLKRGESEKIKKALEINFVNLSLLLSQNNQARQDLRSFLEEGIKRELRKGEVILPIQETQPHFVGSQSQETKDSTSQEPASSRQTWRLVIGEDEFPLDDTDEGKLASLLESILLTPLTHKDLLRAAGVIEEVWRELNSGLGSQRLGKIKTQPADTLFRIKVNKNLRALVELQSGRLKVIAIGPRNVVYRRF